LEEERKKRRNKPNFHSIDDEVKEKIDEAREKCFVLSNVGYNGPNGLPINKSKPRHISNRYFRKNADTDFDKPNLGKVLWETKNFVVQLNYETRLIELYGKDFFFGKLFKIRFNASESFGISNLLVEARNRIEQKQKVRIGETSHFIVDLDGTQKLVILYEKNSQDVRLGFNESEINPILDFLAKARSLF
jgi:hypothetical protein